MTMLPADDFDFLRCTERERMDFVQSMLQLCRSNQTDDRKRGAQGLYDLAYGFESARQRLPELELVIDGLVLALADLDDRVRECASYGLAYCSPESVLPLAKALKSQNADELIAAANSLGTIGNKALVARSSLLPLLTHDVQAVRSSSARALGLMQDPHAATVAALVQMACSEDLRDRGSALHALGNIGTNLGDADTFSSYAPLIVRSLDDPDDGVRWSAMHALSSLPMNSAERIAILVRMLHDKSLRVADYAVSSLKKLSEEGVDLSGCIEPLREYLGRNPADYNIYTVLGSLGKAAKPAIKSLRMLLNSSESHQTIHAAEAIWQITNDIDGLLEPLARAFDQSPESACDALALIGPAAAPLIPQVIAALNEEYYDLQWAAADALGAINDGRPEAIDALIQGLKHPSGIVASACAGALGKSGGTAVPKLIDLLEGHDPKQAEWAADALSRIGPQANAAHAVLAQTRHSVHRGLRFWSCVALANIASDIAVLDVLLEALEDESQEHVHETAAKAIGSIGPAARFTADRLSQALIATAQPEVVHAIEDALGKILTPVS